METSEIHKPGKTLPSASEWLDQWMELYPWRDGETSGLDLIRAVSKLPPNYQVKVHIEAVNRLPLLRSGGKGPQQWRKGEALYELVCHLYSKKLPRTEPDICTLLCSSKHDCGHGLDVLPPFQLAIDWARGHGFSPSLLAAVRTFIDGLANVRSVKANSLKTKARLVLLLESVGKTRAHCWSEVFRRELAALPAAERDAWARMLAHMSTALGPKLSKHLIAGVRALVEQVEARAILTRLDKWLPNPALRPECRLETTGTYLLKNLVWILLVLSEDPALTASCDPLVERLSRLEFMPPERGKQVALACAAYFSLRPPNIALSPLERLRAWSVAVEQTEFNTIRDIADAYKRSLP